MGLRDKTLDKISKAILKQFKSTDQSFTRAVAGYNESLEYTQRVQPTYGAMDDTRAVASERLSQTEQRELDILITQLNQSISELKEYQTKIKRDVRPRRI